MEAVWVILYEYLKVLFCSGSVGLGAGFGAFQSLSRLSVGLVFVVFKYRPFLIVLFGFVSSNRANTCSTKLNTLPVLGLPLPCAVTF